MQVLEIVACSVLLIAFIVFVVLGVIDCFKTWQIRKREQERREQILKNLNFLSVLPIISDYLESIKMLCGMKNE